MWRGNDGLQQPVGTVINMGGGGVLLWSMMNLPGSFILGVTFFFSILILRVFLFLFLGNCEFMIIDLFFFVFLVNDTDEHTWLTRREMDRRVFVFCMFAING